MLEPATLVYRAEARPDASIAQHIVGNTRNAVTSAIPKLRDEHGNVLGVEQLRPRLPTKKLRELRREFDKATKGKRGRPTMPYAEHIFVAEKRVGGRWTPDDAREWAARCVDALEEAMPESITVCAAVHLDEPSYHLHVLTMPRATNAKGELIHGIQAARLKADLTITGNPLNDLKRPRQQRVSAAAASRMQDFMWERVGQPYGLKRGVKGSKRKNKALSDTERAKAAIAEMGRRINAHEKRVKRRLKKLGQEVAAKKREVDAKAKRIDTKARMKLADRAERKARDAEAEAERERAELAKEQAAFYEDQEIAKAKLAELEAKAAETQRKAEVERRKHDEMLTKAAHFFRQQLAKHRLKAKDIFPDSTFAKAHDAGRIPTADEIDFAPQQQVEREPRPKPGAALDELNRRLDEEERRSLSDRSGEPSRRR